MKSITVYESDDGETFKTVEECFIHEQTLRAKKAEEEIQKLWFSMEPMPTSVGSFIYKNFAEIEMIIRGHSLIQGKQVKPGDMIMVRDYAGEEWNTRVFKRIDPDGQYVCEPAIEHWKNASQEVSWILAKLGD